MEQFILTGPHKGKSLLLNNRYEFKDGVLTTDAETAEKIAPILCGYYSCERKKLEVIEEKEEKKDPSSLKKGDTKGDSKE